MPEWIPDITLSRAWEVFKWLGPTALVGILLWLVKLPQKVWHSFERRVVFRHEGIPRRPMLALVRAAEWHFGSSGDTPGTQFHFQLTITNLASQVAVEIIEVRFRRAWKLTTQPLVAGAVYVVEGGRGSQP